MPTNNPMRIDDPLPQRYLTSETGVGGRIKARPEDFLVDELPLYEPQGTGEHLYLRVQKRNVSHGELISCIRRHFNVREAAIGFAGMKDKVGITQQTISIHMRSDPPDITIPHERIAVLWTSRHLNKIRRGHLAGNRFSIRIRDVDPCKGPAVLRAVRRLQSMGVPNYFGSQRFGYRRNNHLVGAMLVKNDCTSMLAELLGAGGTPFPEYQRERRELYDAGKFAQAADLWTTADRAERIAINALRRGGSHADACRLIGAAARSFWISSLQSAIFNRVLDRRLDDQTLAELHEGDVAWKHDSRAVFAVTEDVARSEDLPARLAALAISPSGPLWGRDMMQAGGCVAAVEREALELTGMTPEEYLASPHCPTGARRPLRSPLMDPEVDSGIDEHGGYIRVAFDLPRGVYATVVLREIMKTDSADAADGGE